MQRLRLIGRFVLRFAVVYGLLIMPWPGWKEVYSEYYRSLGNMVFGGGEERRSVDFERNTERVWPVNFDTLIVVANRDQLDHNGIGPQIRLGLDTRQMGWIPSAVFLALTLAVPMTWKRRVSAWIWGVLLTQGYLIFSLWVFIGNESTRLSLLTLAPFWKNVAQAVETSVIYDPVGPNLLFPVLVFVVVAIRAGDEWFLPSSPRAASRTRIEPGFESHAGMPRG